MFGCPLLLLFSLPLVWSRSNSTPSQITTSNSALVISLADIEANRINVPACALKDFRGTDNLVKWAVYFVQRGCPEGVSTLGVALHALAEDEQLMWLSEMEVESSVRAQYQHEESLSDWIDAQAAHMSEDNLQQVFVESQPLHLSLRVLHHDPSSSLALISIPISSLSQVDLYLPRFGKLTALSASPLLSQGIFDNKPIPDTSIARIASLLESLPSHPSSKVLSILSSFSLQQMNADIRWLTGEDPKSPIVSRHSFTQGARTAALWLKEQFEASGAQCDLLYFLPGFAPNVRCRYTPRESDKPEADDKATIILGAHYDSRGSFGSLRHPGGDDDGSGIISLLSIARAIKRHRISFGRPVELVAFAGEEQGLLGSKFYSALLRDSSVDVLFMIQADMLAYRAPGEDLQLALPLTIGLPELRTLVANVSALYSPELVVGTSAACCSDHQSFFEQGYPATQVFERNGPIVDPMYHNTGDVSDREGYSFEQVRGIAKVTFATLLHASKYKLSKQ